MTQVKVEYVHHVGKKRPGDTETVAEARALELVDAGVAKIADGASSAPATPAKRRTRRGPAATPEKKK